MRASFVEDGLDVQPIHAWADSRLGKNDETTRQDQLVLVVRGDLFKKYPRTKLYAIRGTGASGSPQFTASVASDDVRRPIFQGSLPTDMKFFGFELTGADVANEPWFFVFEESAVHLRFGLDEVEGAAPPLNTSDDLAWSHVTLASNGLIGSVPSPPGALTKWSDGAAHTAAILFQRPVRISVAARRLIAR